MPFKSAKQRRYLFAKEPEVARRFADEEKAMKHGKHAGRPKKGAMPHPFDEMPAMEEGAGTGRRKKPRPTPKKRKKSR